MTAHTYTFTVQVDCETHENPLRIARAIHRALTLALGEAREQPGDADVLDVLDDRIGQITVTPQGGGR